jgi:hypothetical protein
MPRSHASASHALSIVVEGGLLRDDRGAARDATARFSTCSRRVASFFREAVNG